MMGAENVNPDSTIRPFAFNPGELPESPTHMQILLSNPANARGIEMEIKAARLLRGLPYVANVIEVPKHSKEDNAMIDAIVIYGDDQSVVPASLGELMIGDSMVQIKSSSTGERHFRRLLSKKGIKGPEAREQWMLQNRVITLIVDFKSSRSGRTIRKIPDEEIIFDFETQLKQINSYARNQMAR